MKSTDVKPSSPWKLIRKNNIIFTLPGSFELIINYYQYHKGPCIFTDNYLHLIDKKDSIQGIYNAGFENISILDIAKMVTKHVPSKITVVESNDPRSYRINSDKLLTTGFAPKKSVEDAIREICEKHNKGALKNEDRFHNLKWMQTTILK